MVAGLYFLPIFLGVILVSLGCLLRACYIFARFRHFPINRYALAVPAFWLLAVALLRFPR